MGQYENDGSVAVNLAKVLLMLVNMAFLVGGGLLIYFSQRVKSAGWLEAFQGDYAWIGSSTLLFILILGALVVALAGVGCFGAWFRNRIVLTVYAVVLIVAAALFVVVAIGANSVKSQANTWAGAKYPAAPEEASVGENFNKLYCYAQVIYYCGDQATVSSMAKLFNLAVPAAVTSVVGSYTVPQVCALPVRPAPLLDLCAVCDQVAKYKNYQPVYDWAMESCPRTSPNQIYCGSFLMSGGNASTTTTAGVAPYTGCRTSFLELVTKWSNFLFACGLIATIAIVAVFGFACLVRQGTNRPYLDESFVVDSP